MDGREPLPEEGLSIDALAARAGVPTRTIREYQTVGLLPPPERRGRLGIYRDAHLRRLQLIDRLQERGYSLAGIRDLLTSWHEGRDIAEILGVGPDELVHIDEPGAPVTVEQLERLLPQLVPDRLDEVVAVGLLDRCGPDRYCVPSPSLLQLASDALATGYRVRDVLDLLTAVHDAAGTVADAAARLLTKPPSAVGDEDLTRLVTRGRGLLAHGTGRMTIYELGQRLARSTTTPSRRSR